MLHRTGKNWLLNLHFPLQAAWLRQSDSAVSSCHLLFPFLALPQWQLAAPPAPRLRKRARSLRVCWLRISREHPCVHTSRRAGFLVSFTVPWAQAPACLQARGAEQEESTHEDVQPSQQHHHIQSSHSPSKCRHPIRTLKLQTIQSSSSPEASHKWPLTSRSMI